jgi:hypothetical protein
MRRRGPLAGSKYKKLDIDGLRKSVLLRIANADARVILESGDDLEAQLCWFGLLPADFARLLHVSPGTVSKWLSGANKLPEWVPTLFEIAVEYEGIVWSYRRRSMIEDINKSYDWVTEGD